MLEAFCSREIEIEMIEKVPHLEQAKEFTRAVGYDHLKVRFGRSDG